MKLSTPIKLFLLFLMGWGLTLPMAHACSCAASSFCETAASADLVVVVSIKKNLDDLNAVDIKIVDRWKGEKPNNTRFRVWGGPWADLCGPNPRVMKEGEKWVLSLFRVTSETHPDGPAKEGDFFLPVCSNSLLKVEGGKIEGRIFEDFETDKVPLKQLERKLRECAFPKVFFEASAGGFQIQTILPIPEAARRDTWELVLRDYQGREVKRLSALIEESRIVITTDDIPYGVYVLQVYIEGNTRVFKGILGQPSS